MPVTRFRARFPGVRTALSGLPGKKVQKSLKKTRNPACNPRKAPYLKTRARFERTQALWKQNSAMRRAGRAGGLLAFRRVPEENVYINS